MNDELKAAYNASVLDYAKGTPPNTPMDKYGSGILSLTNPEGEIYKLQLSLRNQWMDERGQITSLGTPLMTDQGINRVIGFVQSIVNSNTIMSNYKDDQIAKIILFNYDVFTQDLIFSKDNFGIQGDMESIRNLIINTTFNLVMASIHRAKDQGEKGFLSKSTQEIMTKNVGSDDKKAGWSQMIQKAMMG